MEGRHEYIKKQKVLFPVPVQLKYLYMDYFAFTHIAESVHYDHTQVNPHNSLELIDISHTHSYDVMSGTLTDLYSLRVLNLSHNHALLDSNRLFQNSTNLEHLRILGNNITTIMQSKNSFMYNTKLQLLDLFDANIEHIHHDMFVNLNKLSVLDVSLNQLTEVNFSLIGMPELQIQNLSHNRIQTLHGSAWEYMHTINRNCTIALTGNPLICSCKIEKFIN